MAFTVTKYQPSRTPMRDFGPVAFSITIIKAPLERISFQRMQFIPPIELRESMTGALKLL